jgi:hypothetical protein
MMKKTMLASAVGTALLVSAVVCADTYENNRYGDNHRFNFKALDSSANAADWDAAAPWKLPQGYTQRVVSDETSLNIYDGGRNDWPDMNTVNETGAMAGRYLYRTHELRFPANQPVGGALSVVDLKTGVTTLLASDASWDAVDGIRWTPWGTILFAEETDGGRLFEVELNDDLTSVSAITERGAAGHMAHEGIDLDKRGNVYVVDEHRGQTVGCGLGTPCGGGVYKFVPDSFGDLSSGALYALKVTGIDGTGHGEWIGPIDPDNVRESGTAAGATSYQRPEDLEVIGNKLFVAVTEGPVAQGLGKEVYDSRVLAIDLETMEVANFVKPGLNVAVEIGSPGSAGYETGFDNVDNLAESPNGDLIMIEDNVPSDIWFADSRTNDFGASVEVKHFASLTDAGAEGTGIYFSPLDPKTLYVNVQHSQAADGDATWAITKERE